MSANAKLLQTVGLGLRTHGRVLINGLDWSVSAGQCWCVIGRNGAGKSTLLQTIVGLRPPDAGAVMLKGRALPVWQLLELARQRAFLPQSRSDAFGYTVIDSILTARHPYQNGGQSSYWDSDEDYDVALSALRALDVAELAERDIRTLSGGERQRVAIAAVVAQDTPLLLLDEPANSLDLAHQVSVMHLLGNLCRESGKAVIMVSHDLNLAHGSASHALLLMGDGTWLAGPVAEIMQATPLSACLGHPIDIVQHAKGTFFIPGKQPLP